MRSGVAGRRETRFGPALGNWIHRRYARNSLTIRSALLRQMFEVEMFALAPVPPMNSELSNWRATSSSVGGTSRYTPLRLLNAPNCRLSTDLHARISARATTAMDALTR